MSKKYLTPINLSQNELQNAVIQNLGSAPSSPLKGQTYFNSTSNTWQYYDGTTWQTLGTGSGSGNVTKGSNSAATGTLQVSGGTDKSIADSTVSGIVKATSGVVSAAVAGTDYLAPNGNGSALTGITESQVTNLTTDLAAKAPLASPTFTGTVTVPTTVNATDAAQKQYVDSVAQGLNAKISVYAVATSNVTLSGTQTIDGVSLVATNRVLLTGQTTASQNGIWVVAAGSWTRPTDFATGSSQIGTYVFVDGGTANAASGWVLTGTSAVTVDTTAQTWTQFSGAGEITAGTGLSKSGNTLSVISSTTHKYTATIGDGSSTSIAVTHSLGTQDVIVQIRDASTNAVVECDVVQTSTTVSTLTFTTAPASNAYKVVIIG